MEDGEVYNDEESLMVDEKDESTARKVPTKAIKPAPNRPVRKRKPTAKATKPAPSSSEESDDDSDDDGDDDQVAAANAPAVPVLPVTSVARAAEASTTSTRAEPEAGHEPSAPATAHPSGEVVAAPLSSLGWAAMLKAKKENAQKKA
jgi:hypothetical protein